MGFGLNDQELDEAVAKALAESDKVYPAIGLFTRWFNSVESQIGRLIAHVLQMKDFERFELLAKGLMPKQKVDVLRRSCTAYAVMDENLQRRLEHFEKRCIKMRNRISHSDAMPEGTRIHFGSIAAMPSYADDPTRPSKIRPAYYETKDIFRQALWLKDFYFDLDVACQQTWRGEAIKIDHPRSTLP